MITNYDDLELLASMTLGFDQESAIEIINAAYDDDEDFKYDIDFLGAKDASHLI